MTGSLTTADVFDLLTEHAECWCPDSYKTNGVEADVCPKHDALRGYGYAADGGQGIPQQYLQFEAVEGHRTGWDETPRVVIALLVWRITAEFAQDESGLVPQPGQTVTDAAEQYVRDRWVEAEAHIIDLPRMSDGRIISRYLDRIGLYDDYQRIRRNAQHMAFETTENHL